MYDGEASNLFFWTARKTAILACIRVICANEPTMPPKYLSFLSSVG